MFSHVRSIRVVGPAVMSAGSSVYAQQVFRSVHGRVTDQAAAKFPNANVSITDKQQKTRFEVTTDASGNYGKNQLISGTYVVTNATMRVGHLPGCPRFSAAARGACMNFQGEE